MTSPNTTLLALRVAVENATASGAAGVKAELAGITAAAQKTGAESAAGLTQIERAYASVQASAAATSTVMKVEAAQATAAMTRTAGAAVIQAEKAGAEAGGRFAERWNESIRTVAKPLLATLGVFELAEFLKDSIGAAKDEVLQIRRINQAFGESATEVHEWAETTARAFGYTSAAASKAAADYGTFLEGQGIGQVNAAEMSTKLTELTADMAKFRGVDTSTIQDALTNALAGRGVALRKLGVDLDNATAAQYAYSHGIAIAGADLTDAQKAEANYALLLEKTANQQGAYAKSADSLGSAQQQLANAMDELKVKVGTGLIPVLKAGAVFMRDGLMPVLSAVGSVVGLVGKVVGAMPSAIQTMMAAWLIFRVANVAGLFTTIATQAGFLSLALTGAEGVTGAFGKAAGAASGFFSFLATAPGFLALAGVASMWSTISSEIDRANKSAQEQQDTVDTLAQHYSALGTAADKVSHQIAFQNIQNLDGGVLINWAKSQGISMKQLTDAYLDLPGSEDVRKKLGAWREQMDKLGGTNVTRTLQGWTGVLGAVKDSADAAQSAADAAGNFLGAQDAATEKAKDMAGAVGDSTEKLTDQQQALQDLAETWTDLDSQIVDVITHLDKLAGRNQTVDEAVSGMYQSEDDLAAKFKLGQQGAKRFLPDVILDPSGKAILKYPDGRDLQAGVLDVRDKTVKAAQAAADQVLANGGTEAQAKAAAASMASQGYTAAEQSLATLLGSKEAADKVLKAYGDIPDVITTDVVLNADQAIGKYDTLIGKKQDYLGSLGTAGAGEAGSATGTAAAGASGTVTGSASTYAEQVPTNGTVASNVDAYTGGAGAAASSGAGSSGSTAKGSGLGTLPAAAFNAGVPSYLQGKNYGDYSDLPSSVTRWKGIIDQALTITGHSLSDEPYVMRQINQESTGNPKATNGHALGIMQTYQATYDDYKMPGYDKGVFDPLSDIIAGIRYAHATYGQLSELANPNRKYANGVPFGSYDSGGWLPPGGVAVSGLQRPEAVLAPDQWATAKAAIERSTGSSSVTIMAGAFPINITTTAGRLPSDDDLEGLRERISTILTEEQNRVWRR